jgi:hypothetical protein
MSHCEPHGVRAAAGFALNQAGDFTGSEVQLAHAVCGLDALPNDAPRSVDVLTMRVKLEELRLDNLVEMGRADPHASDGGAAVLLRCDALLALAPASSQSAEIRTARFKACHQKTRMLMLAGDEIGALPYAREAADYAAHSADPEHRAAEPLMRVAAAHGLGQRGDVAQAVAELRRAARSADSVGDVAMSEIVLWDLERLLVCDDPLRAVVVFGELADGYRLSGDERQGAMCVFAYAGALERARREPDLEHDLEIFERYHRSLMLFDQFGDVSHAADAYYRAGVVLSRVAALHAEYRERAAELLLTAVRKFGEVGNWHGQGVAQAAAAELLNRGYEGVAPDHAVVERRELGSQLSDPQEFPARRRGIAFGEQHEELAARFAFTLDVRVLGAQRGGGPQDGFRLRPRIPVSQEDALARDEFRREPCVPNSSCLRDIPSEPGEVGFSVGADTSRLSRVTARNLNARSPDSVAVRSHPGTSGADSSTRLKAAMGCPRSAA